LNASRYISEYESIDVENTKKPNILESNINKVIEKAIVHVGEVVRNEEERRKDCGLQYTHDKFFKEHDTNRIIREHIISRYSKEN
jgi:hypothetical protein